MKIYKKYFKDKVQKRIDHIKTEDKDALLAIILHEHIGTISGSLFEDFMLYEAIIDAEPQKKEIQDIFNSVIEENFGKKISVLISLLQKKLEKFKISFKYLRIDADFYSGVSNYEPNDDFVYISLTNKILKEDLSQRDYQEFVNEVTSLISHEIIHRFEAIKMANLELANKLLKKDLRNKREYFGSKYEIMSYAWQIVNSFRMYGKKDRDIKIILQSDSAIKFKFGEKPLEIYHDLFTIKDKELRLLYKYMYMYLE